MDSIQEKTHKWLPPGALVFTGKKKVEQIKLTVIEYSENYFSERIISNLEELPAIQANKNVSWINICGLHDIEMIEKIGAYFNLHPLLLEDVLNVYHSPKLDNYDEYLFLIAKMIDLNPIKGLNIEQISFILSGNTLISFQEDEDDVFNILRNRIRDNVGRVRKLGADYLMYRLLDSIIDGYLTVIENLEDRIELLEDKLIFKVEEISVETIHNLRKEVVSFRRSVHPLRDVVYALQREKDRHIKNATYYFLRDLNDHLQHTLESIEIASENIRDMLELHLSASGRKLNEVIKVLTIISTIFIPLTFIVGIYGMNFNTNKSPWNMPELNWAFGYPAVMFFMLAIAVGLLVIFKRKKWM